MRRLSRNAANFSFMRLNKNGPGKYSIYKRLFALRRPAPRLLSACEPAAAIKPDGRPHCRRTMTGPRHDRSSPGGRGGLKRPGLALPTVFRQTAFKQREDQPMSAPESAQKTPTPREAGHTPAKNPPGAFVRALSAKLWKALRRHLVAGAIKFVSAMDIIFTKLLSPKVRTYRKGEGYPEVRIRENGTVSVPMEELYKSTKARENLESFRRTMQAARIRAQERAGQTEVSAEEMSPAEKKPRASGKTRAQRSAKTPRKPAG